MHGRFTDLKAQDKVEFFVHCQDLLLKYHPDSSFVCYQDNLKERLHHIQGFLNNYKGLCYQDDNVCALYNHIVVTDPKEPERTLRAHLYQQPAADYNAVTIDFVVFKELKDCQRLIQAAYDPRIQYVLFVRHNQVKLYPIVDFLQQILSIPVV